MMGTIFCAIYWTGFEAALPWLYRIQNPSKPTRAALLVQARCVALYSLLFVVAIFALKLILGKDLLAKPIWTLFAYTFGLLITHLVVGFELIARLATSMRELEQARSQSAFLALQAQLSPHTLFNALNTIASLIPEDPQAAEAATLHLGRLLRTILTALEKPSWSLQEEFALLENLLFLEKTRFGSRLHYELHLPEAHTQTLVPPLLLLPLVENSLKHGFRSKVGACQLRVTWPDPQRATICVEDNGVGKTPDAPEGIGLRTVRHRLEALGGRLTWPKVDNGCIAEVHLCS